MSEGNINFELVVVNNDVKVDEGLDHLDDGEDVDSFVVSGTVGRNLVVADVMWAVVPVVVIVVRGIIIDAGAVADRNTWDACVVIRCTVVNTRCYRWHRIHDHRNAVRMVRVNIAVNWAPAVTVIIIGVTITWRYRINSTALCRIVSRTVWITWIYGRADSWVIRRAIRIAWVNRGTVGMVRILSAVDRACSVTIAVIIRIAVTWWHRIYDTALCRIVSRAIRIAWIDGGAYDRIIVGAIGIGARIHWSTVGMRRILSAVN